jgi:hypothetical protein
MLPFCFHPYWFIVLKFTGLPAPVQGGIMSALISTSIAFLVFSSVYSHDASDPGFRPPSRQLLADL